MPCGFRARQGFGDDRPPLRPAHGGLALHLACQSLAPAGRSGRGNPPCRKADRLAYVAIVTPGGLPSDRGCPLAPAPSRQLPVLRSCEREEGAIYLRCVLISLRLCHCYKALGALLRPSDCRLAPAAGCHVRLRPARERLRADRLLRMRPLGQRGAMVTNCACFPGAPS